jgi:signal peptidase I
VTATEKSQSAPKKKRRIPFWLELPLVVVVAVLLAFVVKSLVVQVFFIPSGSMENTLQVGDRVAVNRFIYRFSDPQRGDVVVFDGVDSFVPASAEAPSEGPVVELVKELGRTVGVVPPPDTVFVKRVVGIGGDQVKCCDLKGRISINGQAIDESSYLHPGDAPSNTRFNVVVPEGELWMMGDHRSDSADSRSHQGDPGGGFVPVDRVLGKSFAVIWPWQQIQLLRNPQWSDTMNAAGSS